MLDVLTALDTAECKRVVVELFVAAEERRLLQGYTGVFPTLDVESSPR
jgi:hypothetical protein